MATGGENERTLAGGSDEITVGVGIQFVDVQNALATLANYISRQRLRASIDLEVAQGGGANVQRAVEEAQAKAKFKFEAFGTPAEVQAGFRPVEDALTRLSADAERTGGKINLEIQAAGGSKTKFEIAGQQDVAPAIAGIRAYGEAIGKVIKLKGELDFTPSEAALPDLRAVQQAGAGVSATTEARNQAQADILREANKGHAKLAEEEYQKSHVRYGFEATGTAAELQKALRVVQPNLEAMAQAGQGMELSFAGSKVEGTHKVSGKQDVGSFIDRLLDRGDAMGSRDPKDPKKDPVFTVRAAGIVPDTQEMLGHTRAVHDATASMTRINKEGERLSKWLEMWASGGRPQRAIAEALQGPMSSMFGAEGGAALAGLGGMIGGGALFHVGWAITAALAKIPDQIARVVTENRQVELARAVAVGRAGDVGTLSPLNSGTLTPEEIARSERMTGGIKAGMQIAYRIGGTEAEKNFQQTLFGLNIAAAKLGGTPEERNARLIRNNQYARAALSDQYLAGGGDMKTTAQALFQLGEGGTEARAGMQHLLNDPELKQRLTNIQREKKHYGPQYSDERIWAELDQSLQLHLSSSTPSKRAEAGRNVADAYMQMLVDKHGPAASQFKTTMEQNQLWSATREAFGDAWGDNTNLSAHDRAYIHKYQWLRNRKNNALSEEEAREIARKRGWPTDMTTKEKLTHPMAYGPVSEARAQELAKHAAGRQGNLEGFIGGGEPGEFPGMRRPQPMFSFSSGTELARKMQMEASGQLADAATSTAKDTALVAKNTARLVEIAEGKSKPAHKP